MEDGKKPSLDNFMKNLKLNAPIGSAFEKLSGAKPF